MTMLANPTKKDQRIVTSKLGIPYDGDVSMFIEEHIPIPDGTNYFDLYIGELNLLESMVHSVANIRNTDNLMVLAVVNFHNFDRK